VQARFKDKNVLITGAARRIGRAIARGLADEGANIAVHYNTSKAEALDLCRELESKGVKAWPVSASLENPKRAEALIGRVLQASGTIDYIINNASIFPESRLRDVAVSELSRNLNVNALAPFLVGRSFARAGGRGAIVNFLDTRINKYDEKHAAYHLSKRMLYDLTKLMALDFAPDIRVNGICPGLILPPAGKDESYVQGLKHTNVLDKVGTLDDIVRAVLFLLESPFITGDILFVDGGAHLKGSLYGHL